MGETHGNVCERLVCRRLSRRRFIRYVGILGLPVSGIGVMAGCSGSVGTGGGIILPPATGNPHPLTPPNPLLSGTITDARGLPLAGVTVTVTPLSLSTTSGTDGTFGVRVPLQADGTGGVIDVTVSAPGYLPFHSHQVIITGGGATLMAGLQPVSTAVPVLARVATIVRDSTAAGNPALAGVSTTPRVTFPSGMPVGAPTDFRVSVTAAVATEGGQYLLTPTAATSVVPLSPSVQVVIASDLANLDTTAILASLLPTDAAVSMPVYLPAGAGATLPVTVSVVAPAGIPPVIISGTVQADGTVFVKLKDALIALGQTGSRQRATHLHTFTVAFGVYLPVQIQASRAITPLTSVAAQTCTVSASSSTWVRSSGSIAQSLTGGVLDHNGANVGATAPAAFYRQLLLAAGAPPLPATQTIQPGTPITIPTTFQTLVPGGRTGTVDLGPVQTAITLAAFGPAANNLNIFVDLTITSTTYAFGLPPNVAC